MCGLTEGCRVRTHGDTAPACATTHPPPLHTPLNPQGRRYSQGSHPSSPKPQPSGNAWVLSLSTPQTCLLGPSLEQEWQTFPAMGQTLWVTHSVVQPHYSADVTAISQRQYRAASRDPTKLYLWTLTSEFHIIFNVLQNMIPLLLTLTI